MKRRILSIITALALCLSLCPTWAFAVEGEPDTGLCDHHPAHTEDCGYAAPTEGHDCGHRHTAECYTKGVLPDADGGDYYEIGADTENLLDCHHSHDSECGYVQADPGAPCGYVCHICPIEDLIAALPEQVTEDNADDVRAQLDHILDLYRELDEGEQEEIDLSRVTKLQEALDVANAPMQAAGEINISQNSQNKLTEEDGDCPGHTFTGTAQTAMIYVESGAHNVTFSRLNITGAAYVGIAPGATMNLTLEDSNTIKGFECGIYVPKGATLVTTAESAGSLDVSGPYSAGIGGSLYDLNSNDGDIDCGTVIINGGNITATGGSAGYASAGIGGAAGDNTNDGNGGNITINGGKVTAKGGYDGVSNAPGIGGSTSAKSDGTLTISSADVLDGNTTLGAKGTYTITGDPTADMIVVSEDLIYNGKVQELDGKIYIDDSKTGTGTYFGQTFTVNASADGWTYTIDPAVVKAAGDYTVTFSKEGHTSISKTFTVAQSGTQFVGDGEVKTYNGDTLTTSFSAGDTITVKATPTPTGDAPQKAAARLRGEPGTGQMALYVGDALVSSEAVNADTDGSYTMTVSAADVLLAAGGPGTEIPLTAKFVENDNMADGAGTATVNITAVAKAERDGNVIGYFGISNFEGTNNLFCQEAYANATITLLGDVQPSTNSVISNTTCSTMVNITCTLDLAGHNFTSTDTAIYVLPMGNLTIQDSSTGKTGNVSFIKSDGTLTLYGGTFGKIETAYTLSSLLAENCAYYRGSTPILLSELEGQKTLDGTVTVKACSHIFGSSTTCPACGGEAVARVTIGGAVTHYGDLPSAWAAVQGQTADLYLLKSVDAAGVGRWGRLDLASGSVTLGMAEDVVLSGSSSSVIKLNGGELTLNSGTIRNNGTTGNPPGLRVVGGTLRVSGGTVEANWALYINGGHAEITGGTFTATGEYSVGLRKDEGTVKISGGQFSGSLYAVYNSNGTLADLLAEDYAFKQNGNWVTDTSGDSLTGTVTAEPAPVKITAQPTGGEVTYGTDASLSVTAAAVDESQTITYQWYQAGENSNTEIAGATAASYTVSSLGAGTYSFYCTVTCDSYTVKSETVTVTVKPRQLTPAITGTATKTYDGTTDVASGQLSITLTGVVNGDTVTAEATSYAYDNANAGENKTITVSGITLEGDSKDNYTLSSTTATTTGTITKSQPTIAFVGGYDPSKTYNGQTIPNPTADDLTITGAAFGNVDFTWSATPKDAGTYTLTANIKETPNTAAASTSPLTVTINKATLTATGATVASKPYDGNTTATVEAVTFDGLKNGETLTLDTDYTATGTFGSADAGEGKSVTVTVTLANTAKANNYQLSDSTCTATGTITKADPVVTDVSVSTPATIYESASLDSITLTHGAGDTAGTVALNPSQTLTVRTKGYAWTFTPDDTNNYNTATGTISLTVAVDALQSIAVTTPPSKTTYTYGESFDKTGMVITATYASGATKDVTGEVQISPAELTVTTTELTITYQGKTVTQAITVNPKTVSAPTIELSPSSFVYDGAEKKPAVTVKDGEKMIPADEYTVEYSNNTNVGTTATVTITDKTGGNYTVSGTKTFTITAKPLTGARVEVTGTFTYTGNALTPAPTVTLDGKTLTANTDYTVAYADNTDAGTAKITVTGTGNYSGTAQGTFTIGRATLTADGTGTASGTYGDKLSELTVSGLTAKLGEATVTGTWKLAGGTVPNVGDSGEYTATFTPATGAGNYNALEAQVTLNIAQATAPAPQTGTLNVQNGHAREYTYDLSRLLPVLASGQSFGGEVTYTLKTVNITEAGYYDIDTAAISGTTLTLPVKAVTSSDEGQIGTITVTISSKNFADVDATINVKRVNKQPVSIEGVTAQNGTYNGGTHNGYTGTPTASPYSGGFTTTYATAGGTALSGPPTNAGDYTVTFSLNPNDTYTGSRTLSFTISKASITIKADDKRADVGTAKPALTYTVTGLVGSDTLATAPTLACDADMNTIGQYPITASGAAVPSGGNYNTAITYVPGTLSVTDPTIPVTGVTLNKTSLGLTVGGSERLTATVAPNDATDKSVTWASSNTAVATVDANGTVTAVSAGTATITVTTADGAKTAACTVTVRTNSSGGGSYVPSGPGSSTITVPVSGDKSTVHVSASVSGTTATVSKIDTTQIENVIGDNGQASMVEIDFTGLGKTIDTVKLPAAAIKDIAAKAQNEEVGGLTVKLPEAEISFDANALSAIQAQAGSQITLTVTPAKPTDLNNRQKEAVGSAPVFDLTLRSSSGAITDFRGGYATVSLPYTLAAGQNPSGVVVYYLDSTGNITPCTTMYDVRGKSAIFTTGHLSLYFVGYDPAAVWVNPFSDVAEGAWYYDAVRYASENGLMGGYGNGKFGPNDNLSRAQFAQILFNKEGRPVVNYLLRYNDVADGAWYTEAVRWATSQGVVSGYGNGMFGPNDNITREQLAVMLWRYAGSPAATEKELHFTDTDKASGYALEALRWAVENGVMGGYGNGQLAPQGLATRAQVAQMLMNFLKNK